MSKIPTAKEFLIDAGFPGHAKHGLAKKWMIEFAKLHVKAALEAAAENHVKLSATKDTIRNAYPEDLIK